MYDPATYINSRHHWLTIKHAAFPLTNKAEKKELEKFDERLADLLYEQALHEGA